MMRPGPRIPRHLLDMMRAARDAAMQPVAAEEFEPGDPVYYDAQSNTYVKTPDPVIDNPPPAEPGDAEKGQP